MDRFHVCWHARVGCGLLAAACLVLGACGSSGVNRATVSSGLRGRASNADSVRLPYLSDEDGEVEEGVPSRGFRDYDDRRFTAYGRSASAAEERSIAKAVELYFAATAAFDGRRACSLMAPSLAKTIATEDTPGYAGPYRKGRTCEGAMEFLFKHFRAETTAPVVVLGARVDGRHAYALLGSARIRSSFVILYRERDGWKVNAPYALGFS
jgi:hypothetical protein